MAGCDEGYLCDVCGQPVENITDSDLYLRYVIGEVTPRELLSAPERHIRCNPVQAQFIVDETFAPVTVDGPFNKEQLDQIYVQQQESLVTQGWQRLQDVARKPISVSEYPLSRNSVRS